MSQREQSKEEIKAIKLNARIKFLEDLILGIGDSEETLLSDFLQECRSIRARRQDKRQRELKLNG